MGFYSQNCYVCEHPLLSEMATEQVNAWMSSAVSISEANEMHIGVYDGYGNVGGADGAVGYGQCVYHRACWVLAGQPMEYRGPSSDANDQGWFFEDGAHSHPEPVPGRPVPPPRD